MNRRTKWRWLLIFAVVLLTIYNILPTLIYYAQPLKEPFHERVAHTTYRSIEKRAEQLEQDTIDWLRSYCALFRIKPRSIQTDSQTPHLIFLEFTTQEDADRIRTHLPRAGALIPFVPSQLSVLPGKEHSKTIVVLRKTAVRFPEGAESFFSFAPKNSAAYRDWVLDRAATIAVAVAGESEIARLLQEPTLRDEQLLSVVSEIQACSEEVPAIKQRIFASFTRGYFSDRKVVVEQLIHSLEQLRDRMKLQKKDDTRVAHAEQVVKKYREFFAAGEEPLAYETVWNALHRNGQSYDFQNLNPYFKALEIDWEHGAISLLLREGLPTTQHTQFVLNEAARIAQRSDELFSPNAKGFSVALHQLQDVQGVLIFRIDALLKQMQGDLIHLIKKEWNPKHPDFSVPIVDDEGYEALPEWKQKLALLISAKGGNLVVSLRGIDRVLAAAREGSVEMQDLAQEDLHALLRLLHYFGLQGQGNFEYHAADAVQNALGALREEFYVKGSRAAAVIECSDLAQRILVQNRIETRMHEELLKWQDEYASAQVSLDPRVRYDIPKPTKNVLWNNFLLSWKKLWRGDERKILRWGLDLSGGKTVQIELRDRNGRLVTDDADVKQGINELFTRVNKMGVSEVSIRQLGNTIVIDFPSSQALSARELISASSMSFHVVNERFSTTNGDLADAVNRFLQEVWNEALVTNRKDPEGVHAIAWNHLALGESEAARILGALGLQLASPKEPRSSEVDETLSRVAIFRGTSVLDWHHQTHPLLLIFHHYALEGADLRNIQASYDPSKGNYLSFDIERSANEQLYRWTARFSKEGIVDTERESISGGQGWRMAVVLNDSVISAPSLQSALRDSAMISGKFSQREVQKLVSDLKAGSLTFTPVILSEKNVSPELGNTDRTAGLIAMAVSLLFVIVAMVGYYYFAGVVASVAVLFNLLILWATLQNLQATLSLAGIAGIILTVAMAVDANVLVFERMKEELALTHNSSMALEAGYKRAFGAIFDSNVTTILAALILLNFDAGPIKGFALTLIIGMVSSLFTALFMTRTYFAWWAKRNPHKTLRMSHWIRSASFDFLGKARIAAGVTIATIVIGACLFFTHRGSMFGMDFTGGVSAAFELEQKESAADYAALVSQAFLERGANAQEFQVRSLSPPHHVRVLFAANAVRPELQEWMLSAIQTKGLALTSESQTALHQSWNSVSGQMSDAMRNNALLGLLLAFVSIFIYLMIRFETVFAAAASFCLGIEVLVTLGVMSILHACGVPVQIDLSTIAALMTIIGYCLNDIIIIFDRIREVRTGNRPFRQLINDSLNATLGRTAITSGITFCVLLLLVLLGGSSLLSFSLVMAIGVLIGTLSSWFIASPLLLSFSKDRKKSLV